MAKPRHPVRGNAAKRTHAQATNPDKSDPHEHHVRGTFNFDAGLTHQGDGPLKKPRLDQTTSGSPEISRDKIPLKKDKFLAYMGAVDENGNLYYSTSNSTVSDPAEIEENRLRKEAKDHKMSLEAYKEYMKPARLNKEWNDLQKSRREERLRKNAEIRKKQDEKLLRKQKRHEARKLREEHKLRTEAKEHGMSLDAYQDYKVRRAEEEKEEALREKAKLREDAKRFQVALDVLETYRSFQPEPPPKSPKSVTSRGTPSDEQNVSERRELERQAQQRQEEDREMGLGLLRPPRPKPARQDRSEERYEDLADLFPPSFPRFRVAENLNDVGAYLANASYFITLGGKPMAELKYGIIAVPLGSERHLFRKEPPEDGVMTPTFIRAVRDAKFVDYADGSLYGLDGDDEDFQRPRFQERTETDYSLQPFARPVINPGVKPTFGDVVARKRRAMSFYSSPPDPDFHSPQLTMSSANAAPENVGEAGVEDVEQAPKAKRARTTAREVIPAEEEAMANQIKSTRATRSKAAKAGLVQS